MNKVDGDDAIMNEIMIGQHIAKLFTYKQEQYSIIVWNDGVYAYFISSEFLDAKDLIAIAETVK